MHSRKVKMYLLSLLLLCSQLFLGRHSSFVCTAIIDSAIPDCQCARGNVERAIESLITPALKTLTSTTFFRYFLVDLNAQCPFWKENGQCMMEGCSVCRCEEHEIPPAWLSPDDPHHSKQPYEYEYGWINNHFSAPQRHIEMLERVTLDSYAHSMSSSSASPADAWTGLGDVFYGSGGGGVYVDLLKNPEQFTGYGGDSARRVWDAIQKENCFGSKDDNCFERRTFYRLMSGLRASISSHIARSYLYDDGSWGPNYPLFQRAVGSHKERVDNLYFTFLFILRATTKAAATLIDFPFLGTGIDNEGQLIQETLSTLLRGDSAATSLFPCDSNSGLDDTALRVDMDFCTNAFDESELFHVPEHLSGASYWSLLAEKQELEREFRQKFQNISRVLDCVTCERCRVWGKLQVLGISTAIRILLSEDSVSKLSRLEVVALINTLHQLGTSISFVSSTCGRGKRKFEHLVRDDHRSYRPRHCSGSHHASCLALDRFRRRIRHKSASECGEEAIVCAK